MTMVVQLRLRGYWRRYRQSVTRHGLVAATMRNLRWALRRGSGPRGGAGDVDAVTHDGFDERYGVDTTRSSEVADLAAIRSPNYKHGFRYQSLNADEVERVVRSLGQRYEDFVFLDLGSGKGKILLVAAQFPFRRIVGVEYCEPLHAIAVQNIQRYRNPAQECFDIQSHCADATQFSFPLDPLLMFMFNPFDSPLMSRVLARLEASLRLHPRPVVIVYWNPLYLEAFSGTAFVLRDRGDAYVVFEHAANEEGIARSNASGAAALVHPPT